MSPRSGKVKEWIRSQPLFARPFSSHISAITMLGVPAEMYKYGIQYWACSISGLIVTIFMVYVFLPVFHELQTVSCYSYIEQRFDKRTRTLASGLFMFYCLLNTPVIIYAPAIAFSQGNLEVQDPTRHHVTHVSRFIFSQSPVSMCTSSRPSFAVSAYSTQHSAAYGMVDGIRDKQFALDLTMMMRCLIHFV